MEGFNCFCVLFVSRTKFVVCFVSLLCVICLLDFLLLRIFCRAFDGSRSKRSRAVKRGGSDHV
jgi:hypothetical protein